MAVLFQEGGYVVTDHSVTTPRGAVHRLHDISTVQVRYEVAYTALLPAGALLIATIGFWRYLYASEIFFLLCIFTAICVAATSVGTLTINSLALAHAPELRKTWGQIGQLQRVRAAIAAAMTDGHRQGGGP